MISEFFLIKDNQFEFGAEYVHFLQGIVYDWVDFNQLCYFVVFVLNL